MPTDPNCPKCEGTGHIFVDSLSSRRCICLLRDLYARKMGFMIWNARSIQKSILTKKLTSSIIVVADDDDINPHLKICFVHLGLDSNWVYIDDSNTLQAWLGQRNSAQAENLQDLIEYPFLVLRLGTVGYPNKALPGVICELLIGRVLSGRPTWIVSPRELRQDTCREYSEELMMLLGRYFEKVSLRKLRRRPDPQTDPKVEAADSASEASPPEEPGGLTDAARANLAIRQKLRGKK